MNLVRLRKKDVNELRSRLIIAYPKARDFIEGCDDVVLVREEGVELVVMDSIPAFTVIEGSYIPTLVLIKLKIRDLIPRVVVDEGAIKPLINGADVMIPGIIEYEDFNVGDVVSVWEPKKESPIVVGRALIPSNTLKEQKKGKAIKNLHYAGDKIWNLSLKAYRELKT